MKTLAFTGLDGLNPLGFLAAVGLHRILTQAMGEGPAPRMGWQSGAVWHPVVALPDDLDPVDAVLAHLAAFRTHPVLEFQYVDRKGREQRDLKPPPEAFAVLQARLAADAASSPDEDFWAAFFPGTALDGNENIKPTAFHFTAGQQQFLSIVRELAFGLTEPMVHEALYGPWRGHDPLPQLRWDAQGERNHALLGFDPSREKPTSTAGAEWLAFQALPLFPTAVVRPRAKVRVATTGVARQEGEERFTWPLWLPQADLAAVRAVVQHPALEDLSAAQREALGIRQVLRSTVRRSAQGYGSFTPAEVLPPGR